MLKLESVKMPNGTDTVMSELIRLNASIQFGARGPMLKKDGHGGFEPETPGYTYANVVDKSTDEIYAHGIGDDKASAAVSALLAAKTADKPLTAAQKSDTRFVDQQAEIVRLQKQIDDMTAKKKKD